jgi:hypothetical protein
MNSVPLVSVLHSVHRAEENGQNKMLQGLDE